MANVDTMGELTIAAFRKNAIRSVLLLDERFPKHHQVGTGEFDTADVDVCAGLYKEFNDQGLICDVENDTELMTQGPVGRIRKSDLLVLDLHLDKHDDTDITASLDILKSLADSDHFSLVIVYTATTELDKVGRQLAGSLRGRPQVGDADTALHDALTLKVAELRESIDDIPVTECVDSFLLGGRSSDPELAKFKGMVAKELDSDLKPHLKEIANSFAVQSLEREFGSVMDDSSRPLKAGNLAAINPWFACGSVFVVVANKTATQPNGGALLKVLDDALTDWNPGVVRCLLSEIQNCIASSGCPYDTLVENDVITQVGWLYHAKQEQKVSASRWRLAVGQLTERVLGSLGSRIASEPSLMDLSEKSLGAIEFTDGPTERIEELSIANGVPGGMKLLFNDVLHALNCFLSSERFSEERHYVTTGTILKTSLGGDDEWWLCVEPGCDTVPEQAGDNQFIRLRMLRLKPVGSPTQALINATHSRYIFVQHDNDRIYLNSRDGTHDLVEVYVSRHDQITSENGARSVRFWKTETKADELSHTKGSAIPVSQLRESNASRLLHEAGHHQSRIAVDFARCTQQDIEALSASKKEKQ